MREAVRVLARARARRRARGASRSARAAIRDDRRPAAGGDARRLPRAPTPSSWRRSATRSSTPPRSGPSRGCSASAASSTSTRTCARRRSDEVDLLIVRELVGGLYFGARGVRDDGTVFDTLEYHPRQIERIARRGFELARGRGAASSPRSTRRTCSTPRGSGAESWTRSRADYPDVELEHMLVDNAGMQLASRPERFDVLVTENTFGDILSDVAAAVTGGLGLAAVRQPRRRGPGHLRAGARLGARHRGTRRRQPGRDAALGRADARARARRGPSRRGGSRRRRGCAARRPRPTSAAARPPSEFADAVLRALS